MTTEAHTIEIRESAGNAWVDVRSREGTVMLVVSIPGYGEHHLPLGSRGALGLSLKLLSGLARAAGYDYDNPALKDSP